MSTIVIPDRQVYAALDLLTGAGIRRPETITAAPGLAPQPLTFTWNPDLAAADQATAADIALMMGFGVTLTLAEWQSIKADAAALKAYLGVTTPTLIQTAAAAKAIIRALATIVRSG